MADEKEPGQEGGGEKILSQSEVDTLLNAVKDGQVDTESAAPASSQAQAYDFRKQRKLVRARLPGLKIIHDRFQRSFRQTMSGLVRKVVAVETLQTEMYRYGEWTSGLPVPSCMSIVRLSPLIGQSIVSLEPTFLYSLIDNIFGGGRAGAEGKRADGDFTTIELKMIQKLIGYFVSDLEKAWSTVFELNFEFVRSETNPEYVSIVAPSDVVIVTDFGISFEDVSSKIQLVMPLFALDPIKQLLSDHTFVEQSQPNPNWKIWITDSLSESKLNLKVDLGEAELSMREVLSLKKGDSIQLDRYVVDPLPLEVEGVEKYLVRMGISSGQQAVQIESLITESGIPGADD
ncbi:MAG: flagellar motor switch protein FliM [Bradymonadales bacterium]|nr:MAG: flagellar motor switch protein FliM [Bradymonadales bacterium]